jgi:hypothetical protein
MGIAFLLDLDLEKPCTESERLYTIGIEEGDEETDLSEFEIGLAHFCNNYNCSVLMTFGDESIEIDLRDVWDLLVLETLPYIIKNLNNKSKINFGFITKQADIKSCEYYENKVKLMLYGWGHNNVEYFTESVVKDLIDRLVELATDFISLAIKGGYVDLKEANNYLSQIHSIE